MISVLNNQPIYDELYYHEGTSIVLIDTAESWNLSVLYNYTNQVSLFPFGPENDMIV